MSVKRYTLHGGAIRSLNELYDELARSLGLPDHFGRNLDALWDVLSTDVEGPYEIVWEESALSKRAMGKDFDRVTSLFHDLETERGDFSIRLT